MGASQRRAVGRCNRQITQSLARGQGLLDTLLSEAGEIVAALDAVLEIEAAQPMANQQDPERHRRRIEQKASYLVEFQPKLPVRRRPATRQPTTKR